MRKHALITALILLVLAACNYDAPLVGEATITVDQALLGTWEIIREAGDGQEPLERIVIHQESANLFAIEYAEGGSIYYFKGWLAELEGIRFMQLEFTGTEEGSVGAEDSDLFTVVFYVLNNDGLTVRTLNTDLVDSDLADTASLQAAFAANRDDPGLFGEPELFRKLPGEPENHSAKQE